MGIGGLGGLSIEFRLLGALEVDVDGEPADLGYTRQRCVLATLLLDANRVVSVDQLIDRVWDGRPPDQARATLSGYVSRLRQILAVSGPDVTLTHRFGGYLLSIEPGTVDVVRFRRLVDDARAARPSVAAELLGEALALWRGEPFAGLDTPWLNRLRRALEAERLHAELTFDELRLDAGHHDAVLPGLTLRAAAHPLNERVAALLILALCRCGQQADALLHYDALKTRLADELGADPGPELQQLHLRILTSDTSLLRPRAVDRQLRRPTVVRQLRPVPAGAAGPAARSVRESPFDARAEPGPDGDPVVAETWQAPIRGLVRRIRGEVDAVLDGIDPGILDVAVEPGTNTIGWLLWHLTRSHDRNVSELRGVRQLWLSEGWHARFGRAPDPADTGYRHTPRQVAAFDSPAPSVVLGYHRAVAETVERYLRHAPDEAFDRLTTSPTLGDVATVGRRLQGVVVEGLEHAGQAALLRGILERRAT